VAARAGKTIGRDQTGPTLATAVPAQSWPQRLGARLRSRAAEDGVFRPVRLSLWADLAISAALLAVASVTFVTFFVWLARTQ
jgi:hypothetical protein